MEVANFWYILTTKNIQKIYWTRQTNWLTSQWKFLHVELWITNDVPFFVKSLQAWMKKKSQTNWSHKVLWSLRGWKEGKMANRYQQILIFWLEKPKQFPRRSKLDCLTKKQKCTSPIHLGVLIVKVFTGDPLLSRAVAHSLAPLLTQPCPHCSHSRALGEQWARLCVFTLQGYVQAARLCRGSPVVFGHNKVFCYKKANCYQENLKLRPWQDGGHNTVFITVLDNDPLLIWFRRATAHRHSDSHFFSILWCRTGHHDTAADAPAAGVARSSAAMVLYTALQTT